MTFTASRTCGPPAYGLRGAAGTGVRCSSGRRAGSGSGAACRLSGTGAGGMPQGSSSGSTTVRRWRPSLLIASEHTAARGCVSKALRASASGLRHAVVDEGREWRLSQADVLEVERLGEPVEETLSGAEDDRGDDDRQLVDDPGCERLAD